MAGQTRQRLMFSGQCEIRRVVIEFTLLPANDCVAFAAVFAHCALMSVIRLVTAFAGVRCFRVPQIDFMTATAWLLGVRAIQREVGLLMIEHLRRKADDIGVATFVFRMALPAGCRARLRMQRMETVAGCKIQCNRLMTIQTQLTLGTAIEHVVTVAAVVLQIRMPFDHRARHHQRLQTCSGRRERQQPHDQGYQRPADHDRISTREPRSHARWRQAPSPETAGSGRCARG